MFMNQPPRRRGPKIRAGYSNVTRLSASIEVPASKTTDEMEEIIFLQFSDETLKRIGEKYYGSKYPDQAAINVARMDLKTL